MNALCWLNLLKNVYRFRIFRTFLWGIPTALTQVAVSGFTEHYNTFVQRIELMDNGKTCTVLYISGKTTAYPVTEFHPSNQSELVGNFNKMGLSGLELFPLRIGAQQIIIDKNGRIENEEVFKAVCNGYVIDLSVMQDAKGESKIIDV